MESKAMKNPKSLEDNSELWAMLYSLDVYFIYIDNNDSLKASTRMVSYINCFDPTLWEKLQSDNHVHLYPRYFGVRLIR